MTFVLSDYLLTCFKLESRGSTTQLHFRNPIFLYKVSGIWWKTPFIDSDLGIRYTKHFQEYHFFLLPENLFVSWNFAMHLSPILGTSSAVVSI